MSYQGMTSLRVTIYSIGDEEHRIITKATPIPKVFPTDPMTYAAIFGHGTNPGKPIKGARLNYPFWGRQYATVGTEGLLTIPGSQAARVRVIGLYTPLKWKCLMCSSHAGPMKLTYPNTDEPPTHGCILEFI